MIGMNWLFVFKYLICVDDDGLVYDCEKLFSELD